MNDEHRFLTNDQPSDLETWAALVALGALDEEDAPQVEALRSKHPHFDQVVASFEEDTALLASNVAEPPPADLKDDILEAINTPRKTHEASVIPMSSADTASRSGDSQSEDSATGDAPRVTDSAAKPSKPWIWAAAAVFVAVVGVGAWQFSGNEITDESTAQQSSETGSTPEPSVDTVTVAGGEISFEHRPGEDAGTVRLLNVPAPAPGTAYQMWIADQRTEKSAGVMEPEDITPRMEAEVDGLEDAQTLMISVEPSGGSETPSDNVVATFTVAQG